MTVRSGDACVMLKRTGSAEGASHACMICHKRIHNLCNYGRIHPEVVRQFHEYDAEKHEICSEYCFNDWYVNYTLPLNDIVSRTMKF
jgi:hypothetical protein